MKLLKDNWTFLTLLVAIAISWGSLMTRVEFIIDQQKAMDYQHENLTIKIDSLNIKQAEHEIRLTILERTARVPNTDK